MTTSDEARRAIHASRTFVRRVRLEAAGLCVWCAREIDRTSCKLSTALCSSCIEKRRARAKARAAEKREIAAPRKLVAKAGAEPKAGSARRKATAKPTKGKPRKLGQAR